MGTTGVSLEASSRVHFIIATEEEQRDLKAIEYK